MRGADSLEGGGGAKTVPRDRHLKFEITGVSWEVVLDACGESSGVYFGGLRGGGGSEKRCRPLTCEGSLFPLVRMWQGRGTGHPHL